MPPNAKQARVGVAAAAAEGDLDSSPTKSRRTGSSISSSSSSSIRSSNHSTPRSLQSYIPQYLRRNVLPYHGDFCYSPLFDPRLIVQLMSEGFLPIATEGLLLPKLHLHRSVVHLPAALHVKKSARKKARRFTVSINTALDDVVAGCRQQHGTHCWLYDPLVAAFQTMYQATVENQPMQATFKSSACSNGGDATSLSCPVRFYSVEIWSHDGTNEANHDAGEEKNGAPPVLVGGELGYSVGSIYTSLTGFSSQDSAGSVQLAALGMLLSRSGFTLWDLGMDMEYKRELGSTLMTRADFVQYVGTVRESHAHVQLCVPDSLVNARTMMDGPLPDAMVKATRSCSNSR